ncbi:MAG: hypothetical protein WAV20_01600, partial [Blastocatellia bacterium]
MYKISETYREHFESQPSRHMRVIVLLVAVCCLSIGIAVGAMVRGIARAKSEDNRLAISNARITPDVLSVSFARAAGDVEPCVAHIKV